MPKPKRSAITNKKKKVAQSKAVFESSPDWEEQVFRQAKLAADRGTILTVSGSRTAQHQSELGLS